MWHFNKMYEKKVAIYPQYFRQTMDDLIQFVADAFTKNVTPGNDLDYIFSAYFSNKILYDFEGGALDAIYYPSVPDKLSFENLAIKPEAFENLYILDEVHDQIVINSPKYTPGYFGRDFGHCKVLIMHQMKFYGILNT